MSYEDRLEYEPWKNRNLKNPLGTMGAMFHMIKSSLGSGILSMPLAFKNGGLWASLFCALFVGLLYTHCIHILVYSSQVLTVRLRKPRLTFAEIAEGAFLTGPLRWQPFTAWAKWFVDMTFVTSNYCCCALYIVFTASSLKQVVEHNFDVEMDVRCYILMTTVVVLPIGLISNLKYLVPFSFLAICSLTFGCCYVLYEVFQNLPPMSSRPSFTSLGSFPLLFITVLYALDGTPTVFPIENQMAHPQHFLGCPGVLNVSMVWLMVVYCTMGFFGYLRYGEATAGSITLNITSSVMGQVVKILVTLNVLCSYGLFLFQPCEITWKFLHSKISPYKQTFYYYTMRVVLILGTVLLAVAVPDLEPFVGLVGAIGSSTLILFFPPIIELVTFWQDKAYMGHLKWKLYKDIVIIILWLITLVCGCQDSIVQILELYR